MAVHSRQQALLVEVLEDVDRLEQKVAALGVSLAAFTQATTAQVEASNAQLEASTGHVVAATARLQAAVAAAPEALSAAWQAPLRQQAAAAAQGAVNAEVEAALAGIRRASQTLEADARLISKYLTTAAQRVDWGAYTMLAWIFGSSVLGSLITWMLMSLMWWSD